MSLFSLAKTQSRQVIKVNNIIIMLPLLASLRLFEILQIP